MKELFITENQGKDPEFLKLNLACGRAIYPGDGWVNLDLGFMATCPGAIIPVDLWELDWPVNDKSLDYVLASHIMEHVPHNVLPFIGEFWNHFIDHLFSKMKDGGIIEIYGPHPKNPDTLAIPGHTRQVGPITFDQLTIESNKISSLEKRSLREAFKLELLHYSENRNIQFGKINNWHFDHYLGPRWRQRIANVIGQPDEIRMVYRLHHENGGVQHRP